MNFNQVMNALRLAQMSERIFVAKDPNYRKEPEIEVTANVGPPRNGNYVTGVGYFGYNSETKTSAFEFIYEPTGIPLSITQMSDVLASAINLCDPDKTEVYLNGREVVGVEYIGGKLCFRTGREGFRMVVYDDLNVKVQESLPKGSF